jgi:hypothetical protein
MLNRPADRQFSREYIDFLRIVYHQWSGKAHFTAYLGLCACGAVSQASMSASGMIAISTRMRLILFRCNLAFIIPR